MKRKPKTTAKLLDECAVDLQRIVRMKAAVHKGSPYIECVTCGKTCHWREMDGGHFISRTYTAHKVLEENIHPQCKGCNRFGHKIHDDYTLYMIDTYGEEFVRELNATKSAITKYTRDEVGRMHKDFRQQRNQLERECDLL